MPKCAGTPCDLRCTKVPTIALIPGLRLLKPVGISTGCERGLVSTTDPGHSVCVTRTSGWHSRGPVGTSEPAAHKTAGEPTHGGCHMSTLVVIGVVEYVPGGCS